MEDRKLGRIWSPKKGPLATTGRLLHLVLGLLLPIAGGHWWGYRGAAWGFLGACVGGLGWELLTPILAGPLGWGHPGADLIDAVAVVVGAVAGVVGWWAVKWRVAK